MTYPTQAQYVLHNQNKEPCDASGKLVDPHQPSAWMTHKEADAIAATTGFGVGFVITENDPYFIVDIDGCRDPITGTPNELAKKWSGILPGAAVEISRSGTGYHFWGCCEAGLSEHYYNRKNGIEFYQGKRYVALGSQMQGEIGIDWSAQLRANLTPRPETSTLPEEGPVPEYTGPSDDETLLRMAMDAKGSAAVAFGNKARFKDLWNANADALARFFRPRVTTRLIDPVQIQHC
ncbi:hypothetical protein SAMN05444000_12726 [Shimia gijangensis]|uniref:Bifunctional DNA primase/polymerase, N-terminal n=1 Tax=Shimia gijangensis TaxID=1470563 RepID=A0A1M6S195_9RHOB|nr:hypothetical protein [Shimia gijangensis]SHK38592.1 hypothetical protein SAMN05444000_12726 [Shimia gijangensis]